MTARDDLAALIAHADDEAEPVAVDYTIADAILAAGWVKPKPPTVYPDHDIDMAGHTMSERDELADVLMRADPLYPAVMARTLYENMADAILSRWRLVPVEDPVQSAMQRIASPGWDLKAEKAQTWNWTRPSDGIASRSTDV